MTTCKSVRDDQPPKANRALRQGSREEGLLRRAFEAGRIQYRFLPQLPLPYYDSNLPLAELRLGQWSGVSLKLRISDARRGVLPVEPFIRSLAGAAVTKLIMEQSLEVAIAARSAWPVCCPILIEVPPAVLLREGVSEAIGRRVAQDATIAQDLVIAVDETAMLQRPEETVRVLLALQDHGLRIGLLGFGANYGALSQAVALKPHVIGFDTCSFLGAEDVTCGQTLALRHLVAALADCLPATQRLANAVADEHAAAAACAARLSHAQGSWMQPLYTAAEVGRWLAVSMAPVSGESCQALPPAIRAQRRPLTAA